MICRPLAARATPVGVIGKPFSPFVAIPLLDATESRPDRIDRMLVVRAQMSQLSRQHSGASCGIDNPTVTHAALGKIDNCIYDLPVRLVQLALRHFSWTPQVASLFYGEIEHVRVKFRAVNLKARQTTLVT